MGGTAGCRAVRCRPRQRVEGFAIEPRVLVNFRSRIDTHQARPIDPRWRLMAHPWDVTEPTEPLARQKGPLRCAVSSAANVTTTGTGPAYRRRDGGRPLQAFYRNFYRTGRNEPRSINPDQHAKSRKPSSDGTQRTQQHDPLPGQREFKSPLAHSSLSVRQHARSVRQHASRDHGDAAELRNDVF